MKSFKSFIVTAVLLVSNLPLNALAFDVNKDGENKYIRVTNNKDKTKVAFELCDKSKQGHDCKPLGHSKKKGKPTFYEISELRRQYESERGDVAASAVSNVVIAVIGGVLVESVGMATGLVATVPYELSLAASGTALFSGMGATGAAIAATPYMEIADKELKRVVRGLNTLEQYRQARMLNDNVILDKDVTSMLSIQDLAESLQLILTDSKYITP